MCIRDRQQLFQQQQNITSRLGDRDRDTERLLDNQQQLSQDMERMLNNQRQLFQQQQNITSRLGDRDRDTERLLDNQQQLSQDMERMLDNQRQLFQQQQNITSRLTRLGDRNRDMERLLDNQQQLFQRLGEKTCLVFAWCDCWSVCVPITQTIIRGEGVNIVRSRAKVF